MPYKSHLILASKSPALLELMIPLHCLFAKSNCRARGQFECDVTFFSFVFFLIAWFYSFTCTLHVCLRFEVMKIKQVNCKMSTKKTFCDNFGQLHTQEYNATKK